MTSSPPSSLPHVWPGLHRALVDVCGSVSVRPLDRLAGGHDASHFLFTPQAVARPSDAGEVGAVVAAARRSGATVTFRGGGTSLSGQAGTDSVLVDTRRNFRGIEVLDGGARVRSGPGATVRQVNARLARYGRMLGPDPASEVACTIGGVIANNSSGMACGVVDNAYRTLESSVLVLASGTVIDTSDPDADLILRARERTLYDGLVALRDGIRSRPEAVREIKRLFAIKNTMGYGINSFLDHDRPVDILEHLVVGSEGTLAFVAEATFQTVMVKPYVATQLLVFDDLAGATGALPELVATGLATIELMDAASLRVAQRNAAATNELREMTVRDHAALLLEYREETAEALASRVEAGERALHGLHVATASPITTSPDLRARLWHIRKGLFTEVAGNRPSGTNSLLEDIAVPVERLNKTCAALLELFDEHGYEDSVIFGHAKDGNIHFMINERFDDPDCLRRYEAFTEDMVSLVLAQGGTLKAEHGTGRTMAPFVRRQYGDDLYDVMLEVKRLADPDGVLNPGVLLSQDDAAHVSNLKTSPSVEDEVDRCVECGYCEPVCPSRDLTLTPRERIVARREIKRAHQQGDAELVESLERDYQYDGIETCAADGMCETACPVLINTGDLVRRLRAETQSAAIQRVWKSAARHWDGATRAAGAALTIAAAVPAALPAAATRSARALVGDDVVPQWSTDLPSGGRRRREIAQPDPVAVYFPSCTTTMFGAAGEGGVSESFLALCARAGVALATPAAISSLCCGTPWKSKGLTDGYAVMRDKVAAALRDATRGGELPLVCDASSCTEGVEVLLEAAGLATVKVVDAVDFVDRVVAPRLPEGRRLPSVTLHPTCSSTRLGINHALDRVAALVAEDVVVPDGWLCCAFAGDRGMLHPELTRSATAREAAEVGALATSAHASLNRTCELGMARSTGEDYVHILELLDQVTR
ncbi:MAG: FAD-binding and (Fe-S)-binding domain-containing protein [Marmoricola sp.]